MDKIEKAVEALIERAANASDSGDAMRLTQAASNAANAAQGLAHLRRQIADLSRPIAAE